MRISATYEGQPVKAGSYLVDAIARIRDYGQVTLTGIMNASANVLELGIAMKRMGFEIESVYIDEAEVQDRPRRSGDQKGQRPPKQEEKSDQPKQVRYLPRLVVIMKAHQK